MSLRLMAVAAVALLAAAPVVAKNPSKLIVFGDSLVDAGNLDLAVGSDMFNPVAQGYFPGRFTNGPDYTDLLNQRLYGSYQSPVLAGTGGTNYAFGGARVINVGENTVPDLTAQLGGYLAQTGGKVDPNALYVINFGGNDVFGIEATQIGTFTSVAAYETAVVTAMVGAVHGLDQLGAGHILITGIPNTDAVGEALDAQLQAGLDALPLANATLTRFSYLDFLTKLAADPLKFGVPPITSSLPCFAVKAPVNGTIDCSGFATVDGTHPTAQIQAAIFRDVAHLTGLGTVPEPTSWAMMIAGFGMVGALLRRRQASAA
ncbi:MAG: SGNH/GDSL hydrolase family protein [Janthinobacterium lividum]